ncbi:hypothetical protein FAZ19_01235 [Sphingobacterium alkalisoli]|uniref:Uncharacterized protein n=1 Tax=Sphingobacterium alkalisoli TaxID=1874115 RepID=A0A4U0H882_9SPHI|nr:hypothetical protein [Sphingobacterium alkalisoli]TJY67916.1 hypothetical protein FAZ19_01235 [Sphingobacterium alkalisoli]GGH10407.1 hypothetical protein GCM10011418_08810 [Sphingobacterium alkalisoli]
MAWFQLNPSGDPTNPSDYTIQGSQPSCPGTEEVCAIQANNDGSDHPVINEALLTEMTQALQNEAPTTNVKLKDRPAR